jgi:hypothetical protein
VYIKLPKYVFISLISGKYTCGPCPVYAIKTGQVKIPYDCGFIFSEVNADIVHWEPVPEGHRKFKLRTDKYLNHLLIFYKFVLSFVRTLRWTFFVRINKIIYDNLRIFSNKISFSAMDGKWLGKGRSMKTMANVLVLLLTFFHI